MLTYEDIYWTKHPTCHLAGIDEAGRGCLAGPVVAAAVVISPNVAHDLYRSSLSQINDSKQVTPKKREVLWAQLTTLPGVFYGIGSASAQEVDEINILRATHLAMRRALEALPRMPDFTLVDGLRVKGLPIEHQAIVKGDSKSFLIACASIMAKVTRDHLLMTLDQDYPIYNFATHKGYGTKAHRDILRTNGPCPAHRMTFRPVAESITPMFDFD